MTDLAGQGSSPDMTSWTDLFEMAGVAGEHSQMILLGGCLLILAVGGGAWLHDRVRGSDSAPRLGATLRYASGFGMQAFRLMPVPMFLMVGAELAAILTPNGSGGQLLATVALIVATVMIQASSVRLALGDLDTSGALDLRRGGLQFGLVEWRIIAATLVLSLLGAAAIAAFTLAGLVTVGMASMASPVGAPGMLRGTVAAILGVGLVYVIARMFTFIPAAALQRGMPVGASWRATQTSVLPAYVVGIIQLTLAGAQIYLDPTVGGLGAYDEHVGLRLVFGIAFGLLNALLTAFSIAAASYVYRHLQANTAVA